MTTELPPTLGLVLAGGQARRMGGGDKASLQVSGATILERVLARLKPYCAPIILKDRDRRRGGGRRNRADESVPGIVEIGNRSAGKCAEHIGEVERPAAAVSMTNKFLLDAVADASGNATLSPPEVTRVLFQKNGVGKVAPEASIDFVS